MPTTKTYMARPGEIEAKWYIVDAADQTLGRLAAKIAMVLMGKHRPTYTPHVETGDNVIVLNAAKVHVTGNKRQQKIYDWYTYYPGGYKTLTLQQMMDKHPERVIELAVQKMLPKNKLAHRLIKKLKVYAGTEHPHQAQQPEPME